MAPFPRSTRPITIVVNQFRPNFRRRALLVFATCYLSVGDTSISLCTKAMNAGHLLRSPQQARRMASVLETIVQCAGNTYIPRLIAALSTSPDLKLLYKPRDSSTPKKHPHETPRASEPHLPNAATRLHKRITDYGYQNEETVRKPRDMLKMAGGGPKWLTRLISWAEGKNKQYVESSNETARELEAWERWEQKDKGGHKDKEEQREKERREELFRRMKEGKEKLRRSLGRRK